MNTKASRSKYIIGVHLDLKGMNFKPKYIPQYLADLASQGVNTVMAEYEDAFPFDGIDIAHDPATAWSRATLQTFLREAKRNGIEVIPLQQCLGHLEYALSWDRYRPFAEDREYPNTLRLGDARATAFLDNLLEQVLAAHPESRYVHLGMDEALSLKKAATRLRRQPLDLFLEQLRHLVAIVERAGKKPMIWTDMLERHFRADAFDEFKGRVIFMPWFYFAVGKTTPFAPLGGRRVITREWLKDAAHPDAPPISDDTEFLEDLPPEIERESAPYRQGRLFKPLAQVALWSRLGMEVLGGSGLRFTRNGSVLPAFNNQFSNVRAWSRAILRWKQCGQIGTSWARATSWSPPNLCIDLQWPIVTEMARAMGAEPQPFWPGIPAETISRIVTALGRCRDDWRVEERLAEEMERLLPQIKAHPFEWQSTLLMLRVLAVQRRADDEIAAVEKFYSDVRPVDSEWRNRMRAQQGVLRDIERMKRRVRAHFGQRFHGAAFNEWIRHLFDVRIERLQAGQKSFQAKLQQARRKYARSARAR